MYIAMHIGSENLARDVADRLASHDVGCDLFGTAGAAIQASHYGRYDLVVLECNASDEEVIGWIRGRASDATPVILVSSGALRDDIVHALDAGADDVLGRPFVPGELAARVRAVLRRCNGTRSTAARVEVAGFVLDRAASQIYDCGSPVDLTPREFAIAWFLFTNPGAFASRDAITRAVWGQDSDVAGRTLEQHIHRLRKKLQLGDRRGVLLQAAYGRGYRLDLRPGVPHATTTAFGDLPAPLAATLWPRATAQVGLAVS